MKGGIRRRMLRLLLGVGEGDGQTGEEVSSACEWER